MIKITEIKPARKVSGRSSFLISFPYNQMLVNLVKGFPAAYFHKVDNSWEIPISSLQTALDQLTYFDDIELKLLDDKLFEDNEDFQPLTEKEIGEFKLTPYKHQIEAVNYGLKRKRWLLLDAMGVGKTLEIIAYAETLKKRGLIEHCLIICGIDSLRNNWAKEIKKFSNESYLVLGQKISKKGKISYASMNERLEILKKPIEEFFVIINKATLRDEKIVEALTKSKYNKFDLIACDEIHAFSTATSQQGKGLLKLKSQFKVGATGSILQNSPLSCYVPLSWTENDNSILSTFKPQYLIYDENKFVKGYQNLDVLKEELEFCKIRRTLKDVRGDMPTKVISYEEIELSPEHRKFYEAIKNGIKEEADKIELKSNNLLALTTRLRQATSCPEVLTSQEITSSKIERAEEIIRDLIKDGEKVVVFSTFKSPVYQLGKRLQDLNPLINTGDIDDAIVSENVNKFQETEDYKIFLGTFSKCGTGLTLNKAMYCIMIDTPYTYSQFSQATDRIWRITNDRPAIIKVLSAEDTIDIHVQEIIENKKNLSEEILDEEDTNVYADTINKDELFKLLKAAIE